MLRNYLKTALRNLSRHPFYTFINLFGLAIGMAAGFMILQYVQYDLSYDRFFDNKENIYRVKTNSFSQGELTEEWAAGIAGVGVRMKEYFPEVLDYVIMTPSNAQVSFKDKHLEPKYAYYASENFFQVFSVPLVSGVDSVILKEPFTVVVSETFAESMFGAGNPVGKILKQNDSRDFKITGVFEDLPDQSHMKFDLLYSYESVIAIDGHEASKYSWQWYGFLNYVVLGEGSDPDELTKKFPEFIRASIGDELTQIGQDISFELQPLQKIHLISNFRFEIKPTADSKTIYFLLVIGILVLCIAWINYINLTTARSLSRAREVGIRKVMGSHKGQLVKQFMLESFSLNLIAFFLAGMIILIVFPFFNDLVGRNSAYTWPDSPYFWGGIAGTFFLGIVLSGFYPAMAMSQLKPVSVLKGKYSGNIGSNLLRKGLVVFQFLVSMTLITGTYVVNNQMAFLFSQPLGMTVNQSLIVKAPIFPNDSIFNVGNDVFKTGLGSNSVVSGVTISTAIPGRIPIWTIGGTRLLGQPEREQKDFGIIGCDDQFIDFYEMEIIAGRAFDKSFGVEEKNVILNEAAVNSLGNTDYEDVVGKKILLYEDTVNVVGVVKNFRQESPKDAFSPLILWYFKNPPPPTFYSIDINTIDISNSVSSVNQNFEEAFGDKTFDFFFHDEYYNQQYEAEMKFRSLFGLFAGLSIVVASLGLLGLASVITNMRSKELGIRKVHGASIQNLWVLLSSDFLKLVGFAIFISIPLSWTIMNNWLENFARRVDMGFDTYILPALLLVVISILTVSYHTIKAAFVNPIITLRHE